MSSKLLDKRLVSLTAPASLEAEQYQTLRLKLERLRATRDVRMIAMTSPTSGDGKTLTAINLAAALSRGSNARVLLIEADLRRPTIAAQLGIGEQKAPGLAEIVLDPQSTLQDAVRNLEPFGFSVVLAGSPSAPIHEIFRSPRLEMLLREARERYDYVILDTPPFVPVSDGRLLAQWVDGLLLVVAAHKTPRRLVEEALNLLDSTSVLGIVFNRDDRPFFGYHRHYCRGYFPSAGHVSQPKSSAFFNNARQ
jgi:capsular exopolysaccharide synthesis family protein